MKKHLWLMLGVFFQLVVMVSDPLILFVCWYCSFCMDGFNLIFFLISCFIIGENIKQGMFFEAWHPGNVRAFFTNWTRLS